MAVGEIETMSGASLLTNGNQEQNKVTFSVKQGILLTYCLV